MTGAYRTVFNLSVSVLAGTVPIDLAIQETDYEKRRQGGIVMTRKEIQTRQTLYGKENGTRPP